MSAPSIILKDKEGKRLLEQLSLIKSELNAIKRANMRIAKALEKIAARGKFK